MVKSSSPLSECLQFVNLVLFKNNITNIIHLWKRVHCTAYIILLYIINIIPHAVFNVEQAIREPFILKVNRATGHLDSILSLHDTELDNKRQHIMCYVYSTEILCSINTVVYTL